MAMSRSQVEMNESDLKQLFSEEVRRAIDDVASTSIIARDGRRWSVFLLPDRWEVADRSLGKALQRAAVIKSRRSGDDAQDERSPEILSETKFKEAQAHVLKNHAETFRKLAEWGD